MVIVFDLDDTLYDEIDFVKSGFREISAYLKHDEYFDYMWEKFLKSGSGSIFNDLIEEFRVNVSLNKLIEIYRFHTPNITLPNDSKEILKFSNQFKTALITDGHYIMQRNKCNALGIDVDFCVLTDFYHTKKPELEAFKMVMKRFPNDKYIYIADNPKKDFLAPNKLGWNSIRYKNPNGIYKSLKSSIPYEVDDRKDILKALEEVL